MRISSTGLLTLLAAAIGCAGPGGAGGPSPASYSAQSVAPTTTYAQQNVPTTPAGTPASEPGFKEKLSSMLRTNPLAVFSSSGSEAPMSPAARAKAESQPGQTSAELYLSMAQLAEQGGNKDHARQLYRQALGVEPAHLNALLGLARLEDRNGNLEEARNVYEQAAAAHPASPQALNDLALCLARQGQLDASVQLLERAVTLQPKKVLYRNNLAKVLVEQNRLDQAVACQAVIHGPAVAHYNTGVLLSQRDRVDEATTYLAKAAELDPTLESAQTFLAQLAPTTESGLPTPGTVPDASTPSEQRYVATQVPVATSPAPGSTPADDEATTTPTTTDGRYGPTPPAQTPPPIEVPGVESPTRLGQTPSGLPTVR